MDLRRRARLAAHRGGQGAARRRVVHGDGRAPGPVAARGPRSRGDGRDARGAGRAVRRPVRCGSTRSCATRAASPGWAAGWPTRCATGPRCRRSRAPAKLGLDGAAAGGGGDPRGRRRGARLRARPARHEQLGRPARRRAPPHRRGLPGVRRHGPRGRPTAPTRSTTARRARPAARSWPTTPPPSSSSSRRPGRTLARVRTSAVASRGRRPAERRGAAPTLPRHAHPPARRARRLRPCRPLPRRSPAGRVHRRARSSTTPSW